MEPETDRGGTSRSPGDDAARERGGFASWEEFLDAHADTIWAAVRPFARAHDERMDLFLHACAGLRAQRMHRVRRFRYRPGAPCRFTTYLGVVVRNLALDFERTRRGRYRLFTRLAKLDEVDRLVLEYRFRDGRPLAELRERLEARDGVRLSTPELAERVARVERALSASQRWRLLARWMWRQPAYRIDPATALAGQPPRVVPLASSDRGPERALGARDAGRALSAAIAALPARQQLVLALRFRDGLDVPTTARTLGVSEIGAERLTRDALAAIRSALGAARVTREELEGAFGAGWRSWEGHA